MKKNGTSVKVLWALTLAFLFIFILFPLLCVLSRVTVSDIRTVFSGDRYTKTIWNTVLITICSTSVSVFCGYFYAFAVVFARMPRFFRKFFQAVPVIHLVTPPFVGGLAFILLVGRQGFITKTLFHLDVSLYGFWGLLLAQTLCFFPVCYLFCLESLKSISTNLLDAAGSLGVSPLKTFFRVILPLTFPSVVSSFLFISVSVLSDFGNPMIVGGRFKVLAVEIYTQLTGWLNSGLSAVLGIILLVPSLILFALQARYNRRIVKKTALLGGKTSGSAMLPSDFSKDTVSSVFRLNFWADVLLFVFCSILSFCIVAQLLAIVAGSFQKLWGMDTTFTLVHIKNSFKYGREFRNSLGFAFTASCLSVLIALFVSFCVYRTRIYFGKKLPLSKTADSLIQLPSAVPGTLFGLALSIMAVQFHVRSSQFLILVAITVGFMPFSYKIITSTFNQMKNTLDESALSLGKSPLVILNRVLVPLARGGIFSGWIYNFARGVGTLSAVIFLVGFRTNLLSVRILNLAEQGDWGDAAALAMELTLITFIIIGFGKILGDKYGKKHS